MNPKVLNKIKNCAYAKDRDEHKSIGVHCLAFSVNDVNVTYFDSFGVEHIPKEI